MHLGIFAAVICFSIWLDATNTNLQLGVNQKTLTVGKYLSKGGIQFVWLLCST